MSFDPITESISHFIGVFDLSEEAARARAEYDRFRFEQAKEKEAELLELHSARVKAPYDLKGFDPGVSYKAQPDATSDSATKHDPVSNETFAEPNNGIGPAGVAPSNELAAMAMAFTGAEVIFSIAPPSSLITVSVQSSILWDDDIFGELSATDFASIDALLALLEKLAGWAKELSPIRLDLSPSADNWFVSVKTIMDSSPETSMAVDGPLSFSVVAADDASGYFVNGVAVEELPSFEDLLPRFHADADEAETSDGATTIVSSQTAISEDDPVSHDFGKDFGGPGDGEDQADGHNVVAGANTLVNQTSIFSNWLDAKMFVVAGDVLNFDAISQSNVLIDHDAAPGGSAGAGTGSTTINAAGIQTVASLEDLKKPTEEEAEASAEDTPAVTEDVVTLAGAPQDWAVTTITGDVTQLNWVDQFSFFTDNDRADISITASKTFLSLGENESTNTVGLWEIGFEYDLVIVGGNFIDVNLINQLNVMIDSDAVTLKDDVGADSQAIVADAQGGKATGGIVDAGKAKITSAKDASATRAARSDAENGVSKPSDASSAANGRATAGSARDGAAVAEPAGKTATSSDVSKTALAVDTKPAGDIAPKAAGNTAPKRSTQDGDAANGSEGAAEKTGPVSTKDNLLFNKAEVVTVGEDTHYELSDDYKEMAEDFLAGNGKVTGEMLGNAIFDGIELLRVLVVEGDFTKVNVLNQTNVLGDSDQIHQAARGLDGKPSDQIKITSGSNIQANSAKITDAGRSSEIHAGGEVYSDALIHQAELVDSEIVPGGAGPDELSSEAIAFLSDDMIETTSADDIMASTNASIQSVTSSADVMQQMLA